MSGTQRWLVQLRRTVLTVGLVGAALVTPMALGTASAKPVTAGAVTVNCEAGLVLGPMCEMNSIGVREVVRRAATEHGGGSGTSPAPRYDFLAASFGRSAGATAGGGTPTSEPGPSAEELLQDINTAVQVVNDYWAQHWSEFFTGTYVPPNVVGLYDGSTPGAPVCAGITLDAGNAFYCRDGHYVAWDTELMGNGFTYGDSWVYLVVAHEWGHAIQAQLVPELQTVGHELQADCLAGAALYGSARDGNLQLESGDEKEIANGLTFSADDIPWTRSDDHGDALERIQWFAAGRSGSVSSCLPTS